MEHSGPVHLQHVVAKWLTKWNHGHNISPHLYYISAGMLRATTVVYGVVPRLLWGLRERKTGVSGAQLKLFRFKLQISKLLTLDPTPEKATLPGDEVHNKKQQH